MAVVRLLPRIISEQDLRYFDVNWWPKNLTLDYCSARRLKLALLGF